MMARAVMSTSAKWEGNIGAEIRGSVRRGEMWCGRSKNEASQHASKFRKTGLHTLASDTRGVRPIV